MTDNQKPVIHVAEEYSKTLGGAAYDFGASFGIALDEWQRNVIDDWLAIGEDGKWVHGTCGLSLPRQNGKTALVKVRVMLGIFSLGETILFTCHEVRTSRQVFDALADVLNENGQYPDIAGQVEYIKRSNGYEEIKVADWKDESGEWHKGGKLLFSSRSKGASRGFTADVVVADEAMYMTDEQVAALVPTMASASGGDAQFILLGTPPSPGDNGTVFEATRKSALENKRGVTWSEWSVDEVGDVTDWERIERCNPSIGTRLMRKSVENELAVMAPDCFARERLGWWSKQSAKSVIDIDDWGACATDTPPEDGILVYSVKFSKDGSLGALCVCLKPNDAPLHVELIECKNMRDGVSWFADWLRARHKKAAHIVVDGASNSMTLVEMLKRYGVGKRTIVQPKASDVAAACSMFANAVSEGNITHFDQGALNKSVTQSTKRQIGSSGGWGFQSAGDSDSSIVESAALAYWKAQTTKRNPSRKMRVG